ncbi:TonB-dependent receptor [Aliiglaciecola sp.]|nr:TonB-dependent receptor [Aliiglaciecola sp.]
MKKKRCHSVSKTVFPILTVLCFTNLHAQPLETIEVLGRSNTESLSAQLAPELDTSADFRHSLTKLPGVSVNENGGITAIPQYRGLFGNRVSVQIDGAEIAGAGPNAMDSPLSHAMPKPVSILTVYRGISPVSVGAETLGGAISIDTGLQSRFSEQGTWNSKLSLHTRGDRDADHASAYVGYANRAFFVSVNGIDQNQVGAQDGRGIEIPNNFYARHGYGTDIGFRYGDHSFSGTYQKIKTQESGTPALAMDIDYIAANWYRFHYDFQGSNQDTNDIQIALSVYGNQNQHGMNNYTSRPLASMMMARENLVDSVSRGYKGQVKYASGLGHITSGLHWDETEHNSTISNPLMGSLQINNFNQVKRARQSLFVEWQSEYENTSVKLGARYTQVDSQAGEVANSMAMMNPNIATIVDRFNQSNRAADHRFIDISAHFNGDINKQVSWHASLAHKNRAPSYTELYVWLPLGISAGLADGRNYIGNLALKEESANQLDVGMSFINKNITISPRLFYQSIDDYILGELSTDPLANMISTMMSGRAPLQWQNTDATLWGTDILLNAQLTQNLSLDMAATWVRAKRDDINQPLYRIAPATLSTSLRWQSEAWLASIESELVAPQMQVSNLQDEIPTAGYGLIHLLLQYHLNEHIKMTLNVDNLLDKSYQSHLSGVNRVNGAEVMADERLYATGREISAAISLTW